MMRSARAICAERERSRGAWAEISRPLSVATTPEGADIAIARYGQGTPSWTSIGVSPLSNVAVPRGPLRVRVQKAGFATVEDVSQSLSNMATEHSFALATPDSVPEGMVRAGGMPSGTRLYLLPGADPIPIEFNSFWIDRFEVTNQQFKAFVDAGGYRRREFWTHPFVKGTQTLSWEEAMELFRDSTGRPGPASWQAGSYPHEQDDVPVRGVSWYEAAAYAAFAGKQLPTMAHWITVAGSMFFTSILPAANFGGTGPLAGKNGGVLHRFGTMNLAGNVKEWVANSARSLTFDTRWEAPGTSLLYGDRTRRASGVGTSVELRVPLRTIRHRRQIAGTARGHDRTALARLRSRDSGGRPGFRSVSPLLHLRAWRREGREPGVGRTRPIGRSKPSHTRPLTRESRCAHGSSFPKTCRPLSRQSYM